MLPETFTPELLHRLELLNVRSRRSYLGTRQGGHLSLKRGHGIEFSDYRQYELGDNPRHIDWSLYARSDRLYVKRFQEEQNLTVLLFVDGSASMVTPREDKKWEFARDTALALAYVALMQQDAVTVSVPGHFHSPLYTGAQSFHNVGRELTTISAGRQFDYVREVQRAIARVRFPGIGVFISDFLMPLEEIERSMNAMRAKGLDVTAVQVLGAHDLNPFPINTDAIAVDSETGEEISLHLSEQAQRDYTEYLEQHTALLRKFFFDSRIAFCSANASDDFGRFIVESLTRTGLLL